MAQVELFDVTLRLKGIKRKCRKIDTHRIDVARIPYNEGDFNFQEIVLLAKSKIFNDLREITSSEATLSLNHIITSDDRGFHTTQWEPFSPKNKHFKIQLTVNGKGE